MAFYHGPNSEFSGRVFSKGYTFHIRHGGEHADRVSPYNESRKILLAFTFDDGFEFMWWAWPVRIYFRIRPFRLWFRKRTFENGDTFRLKPIILDFYNVHRWNKQYRQFLMDTDGFGHDTIRRKTYIATTAQELGIKTTEDLRKWYKPSISYPIKMKKDANATEAVV